MDLLIAGERVIMDKFEIELGDGGHRVFLQIWYGGGRFFQE